MSEDNADIYSRLGKIEGLIEGGVIPPLAKIDGLAERVAVLEEKVLAIGELRSSMKLLEKNPMLALGGMALAGGGFGRLISYIFGG